MIPRNHQNRKTHVSLVCPNCGMDLTDPASSSFTRDDETFCCQGCADGTGCTCVQRIVNDPRPHGAIEQREPGVLKGEGDLPGKGHHHAQSPRRYPSRRAGARQTPKRNKSVTKERDSTRQQARGRAEFTGSLNQGGATRVSRTGTKSRGG
jgi:hypothetical protein